MLWARPEAGQSEENRSGVLKMLYLWRLEFEDMFLYRGRALWKGVPSKGCLKPPRKIV